MAYYSRVVSPSFAKISWKLLLLGFLSYLFLTYVIVFFGLYAIYRGVIVSFSVWTILAGIFWVAFGSRGIEQFYLMTEIVKQHSKIPPPSVKNRISVIADEMREEHRRRVLGE
jgi:hypothetical protein